MTSVREIVIGMASKEFSRFTCLRCRETHAAQGFSPGCPACRAPEAFQRKDL